MMIRGAENLNRGTIYIYLARYCFMDAEIRLIETKRNLDERNTPGLKDSSRICPLKQAPLV